MKPEIERKFLVKEYLLKFDIKPSFIKQGYISDDTERAVRIRVKDDKGFITIKGESDKTGIIRLEFEKEISKSDADQLLKLCKGNIIEKLRYNIEVGKHIFEVDVFKGKNEGLVFAEIELDDIHEEFEKPDFRRRSNW